jgi:serine/threonine protein kinase
MLSHYRIVEKIGEGGWGVVWKADDISLKRPVALKFLSQKRHSPEDHKVRFLREARLAAALNHPCICTIYEVAEVRPGEEAKLPSGELLRAGTPFIAMEFLEGHTLGEELRRKDALDLEDLLRIASMVVDGLAAAHARNIVHRDLKPSNVMLTPDRWAKIVDFGLAKALSPPEPDDAVFSRAETISEELSREGFVIGTAAYMSPEQAQGKSLDSRSDVFSFGIMLYEMVAGRRPFRGATPTTTRLKIIEAAPDPLPSSHKNLPPELERIIWRCLNKVPDERYNDTRDLLVALKTLRETSTTGRQRKLGRGAVKTVYLPFIRGRAGRYGMVAGIGTIVVAAVLWWGRTIPVRIPTTPPVHRQVTFTGSRFLPEPSPDGQFLGSVQVDRAVGMKLMLQDLFSGQELEVFRAEEILAYEWTPDGREILIRARIGPKDTSNFLLPRLGGTPRRMGSLDMMTWAPDGTKLAGALTTSKEITILERSKGKPTLIPLTGTFKSMQGIDWSPTGHYLLLSTFDENYHTALWTISASGDQQNKIIEGAFGSSLAKWSPQGDAIFYTVQEKRTWHLMKLRIDPQRGVADGKPSTVLTGLTSKHFSLGSHGNQLFFAKFHMQSNLLLVTPHDGDESGPVITRQITSGTFMDYHARLSPDGQDVAFDRQGNIHMVAVAGGTPRQLTFLESDYAIPAWSPDGKEIAFVSLEGELPRVWSIELQEGLARVFEETKSGLSITWSPGTKILYQDPGKRNYTILDPHTEKEMRLIEEDTVGWMYSPEYSPDGTRVAVFWSRGEIDPESGIRKDSGLYVVSLEGSSHRRVLDGDWRPIGWSADSTWIYATSLSESSWSPTQQAALLKIRARGGPADEMFDLPSEVSWCDDVTPDGQRVLCVAVDYKTDIWLAEAFDPDVN